MSGEDEIIPYAVENWSPNVYETFDDWFRTINMDFESNGRNPLDQILDSWGIDAMKEVYNKSQLRDLSQSQIQTIIDQNWVRSKK